jgi:hypothetical protein
VTKRDDKREQVTVPSRAVTASLSRASRLSHGPSCIGSFAPNPPPYRGGWGRDRDREKLLGSATLPLGVLSHGCPMCNHGERASILDGRLIPCPWCRATGRVPLERCRALRAQLRSKDERT